MAALVPQGPVQFCLSPAFEPKNGGVHVRAGFGRVPASRVVQLHPQRRLYARCEYRHERRLRGSGERSMDDAIALPENRNIKLVAREQRFAVGDISVAAQIARIAASGAQLVLPLRLDRHSGLRFMV